jgi:pimeloyl-ACP methyl ester carboxylesterase
MLPALDSLLSSDFTLFFYDQRGSGWSGGISDTSNLTINTFVKDRKKIGLEKIN